MPKQYECAMRRFLMEFDTGKPDGWFKDVALTAGVCAIKGCWVTAGQVFEMSELTQRDAPLPQTFALLTGSGCKEPNRAFTP